MHIRLWPHPADPVAAVEAIEVSAERLSAGALRLTYFVRGRIDALVLPAPAAPVRANNLWRATCFEAFLAPAESGAYRELNFSPSSQWAAYEFAAYRAGMVQMALPAAPEIVVARQAGLLELAVTVSLDLGEDPWRLGLCAVIEEEGGYKSHWAASHAGATPDFHHPSCFALELPPAPRR